MRLDTVCALSWSMHDDRTLYDLLKRAKFVERVDYQTNQYHKAPLFLLLHLRGLTIKISVYLPWNRYIQVPGLGNILRDLAGLQTTSEGIGDIPPLEGGTAQLRYLLNRCVNSVGDDAVKL